MMLMDGAELIIHIAKEVESEGSNPTDNRIILKLRKMTQDELMKLIGIRKD